MNVQAVIAILGILGSILTICVFCRKRLKTSSYSMYYRVMAVIDCVVLMHTFRHWARIILGYDIDLVASLFCKLSEFQPYVAANCQLWLFTVILADRLVTVVYHNRFRLFKKKWFQRTLVAGVICYCSLAHSILPLNFELKLVKNLEANDSYEIIKTCHLPVNISQLNNFIFFSNTLATICINLLLYIKLISFIFKSRKKLTFRTNLVMVRDLKFAISSILYTMITLTCKVPIGIGLILSNYFQLEHDQIEMVFMICVTMAIVGNGATFYVNFFFNSIFYEEFVNIFRFHRHHPIRV